MSYFPWREENGSSLVVVLAMIAILSALAGAVMTVQLAQRRFFQADRDMMQAQYTAEAGLYAAIQRLKEDIFWRPREEKLSLPGHLSPIVSIDSFGGYLVLVSTGEEANRQVTIRTILGVAPPRAFDAAVYLWDDGSRLSVAGHTRIVGAVYTGQHGVRKNSFKGKPFDGLIEGETVVMADPVAPGFDASMLLEEFARFDSLWTAYANSFKSDASLHAGFLPEGNEIIHFTGDAHLSASDSSMLSRPITVIAEKDLLLAGPLQVEAGSMFIAGERLYLKGQIEGRELLAFGHTGIDSRRVHATGIQLLSRGPIILGENTYLEYPSFVFTTGEFATDSSRIAIVDRSTVDGFVMFNAFSPPASEKAAHILLDSVSLVRGAVYNTASTELRGQVWGSLLTRNTYFYEEPAHYTNWLLDAEVDASERPESFHLPVGFDTRHGFEPVTWQTRRRIRNEGMR